MKRNNDIDKNKIIETDSLDSSSIRVEKVQDVMTSILFTISLWLKTYPNPDDAVTALQNESIGEIYEKGRKRIDPLISAAKAIHAKLLSRLIDTQNVFYRSTLEDGIKGFFKLYDPDYAAHEIHITADYPLHNAVQKLAGNEFINPIWKLHTMKTSSARLFQQMIFIICYAVM